MCCRNALADVLEAAARRLRVLACKRLDLAGDGSVVAQDIALRTVRHVAMRRGTACVRSAHPRVTSRSASRRRSTRIWMRALSEGWGSKNQRHCCHQNQSRVFHLLLLFISCGLAGNRIGFVACPYRRLHTLLL